MSDLQKQKTRDANTRHGNARRGLLTTEYNSWGHMIARCSNPKSKDWKNYGGRGITVCKGWLDFKNFLNDVGKKPSPKATLDRIDNTKGYFKENCRWATRKEQSRNTRKTIFIEINGQKISLSEAAELCGLKKQTLFYRYTYMNLRGSELIQPLMRKKRHHSHEMRIERIKC